MAVTDQVVTDRYAIYCGDCMDVVAKMPSKSVDLSIYSPPFAGLYNYSSSERDFSNCRSYEEFMAHYKYLAAELARVTKPGRMNAVHCMDVPSGNTGRDHMVDFPGDIIRMHETLGFKYAGRYVIRKDPFEVYLRTLAKSLRHRTCAEDSTRVAPASPDYLLMFQRDGEPAIGPAAVDYLLMFRKSGTNEEPVAHATGLMHYAGQREPPSDILKFRGWAGKQTENKYSQWVWRQYASAVWDDIRIDRVMPYIEAREPDDERHVHPLQLDVIDRAVTLWTNPGEVVFTPFMGVGSEVYGAVSAGRKGVGAELKESYFKQARRNLEQADNGVVFQKSRQRELFTGGEWSESDTPDEAP